MEVFVYLLGEKRGWSNESVPLAEDGRVLATADGIHHPVGVVIVHHMDETPSASAAKKRSSCIQVECEGGGGGGGQCITLAFSEQALSRSG